MSDSPEKPNWKTIDRWVGIVALLFVLAAAVPPFAAWSTASPWQDEIYSIEHFTSRGPLYVLTHYPVPNNHIFFNFLNAVTPWTGGWEPWSMRFWSFMAIVTAAFVLTAWFWRAGSWAVGVVCVSFILLNPNLLNWGLQARGYGLLILAAAIAVTAVAGYLETRKKRLLVGLVLAAWLGSWTVPTFSLFALPLVFLLTSYTPSRATVAAALVSTALIAASYAPVAEQVINTARTYEDVWGAQFSSLEGVRRLVHDYMMPGPSWLAIVLTAVLLLGPWVLLSSSTDRARVLIPALAVIVALAIALWLETPLVRSLGYLIVPACFSGCNLWHHSQQSGLPLRPLSPLLAVMTAAGAILLGQRYTFTPLASWRDAAQFIEQHLRGDASVYAVGGDPRLTYWLDRPTRLVDRFDERSFKAGKLVVVERRQPAGKKIRKPFEGCRLNDEARRKEFNTIHGIDHVVWWSPAATVATVDEAVSCSGGPLRASHLIQ